MSILRVLGVARHREAAEGALLALGSAGFPLAQLSVMLRPEAGGAGRSTRSPIVVGGTFGPLVGVRAVTASKPLLLVAGPIGSDGVGLFGTSGEQARRYLDLLALGGVVCAVETDSHGDVALARDVLRQHGVTDIATASSHPRASLTGL